MKKLLFLLFIFSASTTCSPEGKTASEPVPAEIYFPENESGEWTVTTPADAFPTWNENAVQPLLDYLEEKNTKSFMILVNGRIVMEHYFNGHTANTPWYWASAGKTLTATIVGIAEQEGYLNLDDKVSDYLDVGWTSASLDKEDLIIIRHLLTMTSGLDDAMGDNVSPSNLQYKADAGTRWAYHNVYVKLQDVVTQATGQAWNNYFNAKLRDRIGMTGTWVESGDDLSVYWSDTRSMARFGLLALNEGKWKDTQIVNTDFFTAATQPSQNINKAYGYLWWINGEESYHLPQTQVEFNGSIIPAGLNDMFMALGKNDQKIYVVPSKGMVVVRMGNAADEENWALSEFDNELWEKINDMIE